MSATTGPDTGQHAEVGPDTGRRPRHASERDEISSRLFVEHLAAQAALARGGASLAAALRRL